MSKGTSIIDVLIIGDAKKLISATQAADRSMGGLISSGTRLLGVGLGIKEGFDFIGGALDDADALADATSRLEGQLGDLAKPLEADAAGFAKIGLSRIAFTEAAASIADWGNAAKVSDAQVQNLTENTLDAAVAFSVTDAEGRDTSATLDLMEKAASGSAKAAKALGVELLDGVDPATQMSNIVAQLHQRLGDAATQTDDLKGRQSKLQANWENLTTSIGEGVDGPLTDLLGFINDEIDAIPGAIEGWQMLGAAVEHFGREALGPIARVNDALGALGNTLNDIVHNFQAGLNAIFGSTANSDASLELRRRQFQERNGQGSP